ncbi:hypothetical protein WM015_08035 [Bifidobacterium mongoliense]|uniref:hypothetical protein n=1 Tax=Bifidobacterium mongoliense TaxID=518643 RepID=UPI0030ECA48B
MDKSTKTRDRHRFIDEAGDMTFYTRKHGKRIPAVGIDGVSSCFMMGMVHVKEDLESARNKIRDFDHEIESSVFFRSFLSVQKSIRSGRHGFYTHAKNDPAELRYEFFKLMLDDIDFTIQVVVGRKIQSLYEKQHHGKESEFYADLLSHLIKDKASINGLIVDVAQRGSSTSNNNLHHALEIAHSRSINNRRMRELGDGIKFNVQPYDEDPLLSLSDYGLWAVQRVFERGDEKFYQLIKAKIVLVHDLYDQSNYAQYKNYYTPRNPLSCEAIHYSK